MAATKVKLLEAKGSQSASGPEYDLRYWVQVSDRFADGPKTCIEAVGVSYGDPYYLSATEQDPNARCVNVSADPVDDGDYENYYVDVEYRVPETSDPASISQPLLAPIEESWSFSSANENTSLDANLVAMVNTAGDLFETPKNSNRPVFNLVRNEIAINQNLWLAVRDAVNLNLWRGFPALTVKVQNISCELVYHPSTVSGKYWRVTYSFEVNPDTWRFRPLNAGINQIAPNVAGSNVRMPIFEASGDPINDPVPLKLDGSSMRNAAGNLTGVPFLLDFKIYPEIDYATVFPFL